MPHYVALLRGINLGKRRVKMDHLRDLFAQMGFTNVSTYIASGDILFSSTSRSSAKLESLIEQTLESELGYTVPTIIRTQSELRRIVAEVPLGDLFTEAENPVRKSPSSRTTSIPSSPKPLAPSARPQTRLPSLIVSSIGAARSASANLPSGSIQNSTHTTSRPARPAT